MFDSSTGPILSGYLGCFGVWPRSVFLVMLMGRQVPGFCLYDVDGPPAICGYCLADRRRSCRYCGNSGLVMYVPWDGRPHRGRTFLDPNGELPALFEVSVDDTAETYAQMRLAARGRIQAPRPPEADCVLCGGSGLLMGGPCRFCEGRGSVLPKRLSGVR